MKAETFKSLGTTKQLAYINRLENINKQKQGLIEGLQEVEGLYKKRIKLLENKIKE